jgi:quercetin dioxygenase-like cupin family protein
MVILRRGTWHVSRWPTIAASRRAVFPRLTGFALWRSYPRMTNRRLTTHLIVAIALLAGMWGAQASAQPKPAAAAAPGPVGFKRTELQRHDIGQPNHETVQARGDFDPGAVVPKHTHPGEEVGFVAQGELTIEIEGKPTQVAKAGEVFFIPAGTVHSAKNLTKAPTVVISTYIVEKGKPLAAMVK